MIDKKEREARRQEVLNTPALLSLENELKEVLEVDMTLDGLFFDCLKGLGLTQMEMLWRILGATSPHSIVEIGSKAGTSSIILGALVKQSGRYVHCFDPKPHKLWFHNIGKYNVGRFCLQSDKASPWIGITEQPIIDAVFIDGDHNFIPCLVDAYYWYHFLRQDGLMVFHDTTIRAGVRKAIDAVSEQCPLELVEADVHGTGMEIYRKVG